MSVSGMSPVEVSEQSALRLFPLAGASFADTDAETAASAATREKRATSLIPDRSLVPAR
jgi:hypothetical protein